MTAPTYADGWHTLVTARDQWDDAPFDDAVLTDLLEVAKDQVLAFGRALDDDEDAPVNYRMAQLAQARNLRNANKVDPATGGMGDDTFVIRPFPMDWTVKNIIRPKRAVPVVA